VSLWRLKKKDRQQKAERQAEAELRAKAERERAQRLELTRSANLMGSIAARFAALEALIAHLEGRRPLSNGDAN
jgi:hypothetical protein